MKGPWTEREIRWFLVFNDAHTADDLAKKGERTKPAVMAMRRKLKRLRELGATSAELPRLLAVSNAFVETHTLAQIRRRAREDLVPVKTFIRQSRVTGKPILVGAHKRNGVAP